MGTPNTKCNNNNITKHITNILQRHIPYLNITIIINVLIPLGYMYLVGTSLRIRKK